MIDENDLNDLIRERKDRYARRDAAGLRVRRALKGDFDIAWRNIILGNEEPVVANLIESGTRTYAQRIGWQPRIDCQPTLRQQQPRSDDAKKRAERHERQLRSDSQDMNLPATILQANYWLVAHGLVCYVDMPRRQGNVIECRDPLSVYPGAVSPWKPEVQDCLMLSKVPVRHARRLYGHLNVPKDTRGDVEIAEYWDESGITIAYVGTTLEPFSLDTKAHGVTQILDHIDSLTGEPMVFIGRGFSPDMDYHGQFDQAIPALIAQAKIRALQMKYFHRFAIPHVDITATEDFEISSNGGRYAEGPGAVNVLKGGQSRNMVASGSADTFRLDAELERATRLSGAFPPQLSGEPVATIATGKGTEALLTQVDDNARYLQSIQADALGRALTYHAKAQQVLQVPGSENYSPKTVDTYVRFFAASDPATFIQMLQASDKNWLSDESAMDMLPGVDDPIAERAKINAKKFEEVLLASVMTRYSQPDPATGEVATGKLAEIMRLVRAGESIENAIATVEEEDEEPDAQPEQPALSDLFADSTTTIAQSGAPAAGGFIGARTVV